MELSSRQKDKIVKKEVLETRWGRKFLYKSLIWILLVLIRSGEIKQDAHLDLEKLWKTVVRRRKFATRRMEIFVAPEYTFEEEARNAWARGKKDVAIVLLAVALEQCLNGTLRLIIEAKGVERDYATSVLRSQNIEHKLQWFTGRKRSNHIPKDLLKRVRLIFSIRNMIVHFKAIPGHPDAENDSHSQIEKEIKTLGRFQIGSLFTRFHNSCWEAVASKYPAIRLALDLRDKMMPYEEVFELKG